MPIDNAVQPYIEALGRTWLWLVLFGASSALLAYAVASTLKLPHEAHFSYLVSLSEREVVPEYRFDGFYALQATNLFTDTLASWVQTPEVVVAAHEASGLKLSTRDPRQLSRLVRSRKTAPQLVEVTVRHSDPKIALGLASGLQAVMDMNIDRYHDEGIPALRFRVVATDVWHGEVTVARGVIAAATFMLIVLLGGNGVLLAETFRQQRAAGPGMHQPISDRNRPRSTW